MSQKERKQDGRSRDLEVRWLTTLQGNQWEQWRSYAAEWLRSQQGGLSPKLAAINGFFELYLLGQQLPSDPDAILLRQVTLPDLEPILSARITSITQKRLRNNYIVSFIDWILERYYSEPDDYGQPIRQVSNPFEWRASKNSPVETVYNPLPYRYIKELRSIICPVPNGNFSDWTWAQTQTGQSKANGANVGLSGDWFEVSHDQIDPSDPDCVWRTRERNRWRSVKDPDPVTVYEIWSPVRAVALYVKLQLPLRNYQVRMLDSGEADTFRYSQGHWMKNERHGFALGSERSPWRKGVFRRIVARDVGEIMTGLYINTNKTADQNKDEFERGYVIPWQHPQVLYWLEKLRNWQEKYNPINGPTPFAELDVKHFGTKKSAATLAAMGSACFLFRNASSIRETDRCKPINSHALDRIWYQLLETLEQRVAAREETLSDGTSLKFVHAYPETHSKTNQFKTEFPLHSLRVSLLTCYALEGSVPAPVLSKLLAGHSRLIMTLYYTKITPATFRDLMDEAQARIDACDEASFRRFLRDAELSQIEMKTVCNDAPSVQAALVSRNPIGWAYRHIGLCLVGGNVSPSGESSNVGGCWNGGENLIGTDDASKKVYDAVPNGPGNCVRCRWFITEARYLDTLRAHFNNLSYRAWNAAQLAITQERQVEVLEDERSLAASSDQPFTKQQALQEAERRWETQTAFANELANDMNATFRLIGRLIHLEEKRDPEDDGLKLVAVGAQADLHMPLSLIEVNSELWQLAEICEDAELYPDEADELQKTPAVLVRAEQLNLALMREGYAPIFMNMDDHMKLIAGNAMIRAMARQARPENWRVEGFRVVSGIIETGQTLQQQGLLKAGVLAIEELVHHPIMTLDQLRENKRSGKLIYA